MSQNVSDYAEKSLYVLLRADFRTTDHGLDNKIVSLNKDYT